MGVVLSSLSKSCEALAARAAFLFSLYLEIAMNRLMGQQHSSLNNNLNKRTEIDTVLNAFIFSDSRVTRLSGI